MLHRYPESPVFYRRLDRAFPLAASAAGCAIFDEEGRRYLDFSGGAMVANLGHGPEGATEVAEAMAEAARLGYVNGTQFTHRFVEELAAELVAVLPGELQRTYFLCSGSEAIEAAVKLARQVWWERGRREKWKVIARVPSYHGNTLTALSLSGREHYRTIYGPLLTDFPRIPAPDPYRRPDHPATTGEALEEEILRQGPETVAAFLAEPIGGSSSGAVVPDAGYWRRIVDTCRRHGVLLIADEVLTGMGRTGRWLAGDHYDLVPDVVVLGKGISGGMAPLSAVVAREELVAELARGSGAFNHAQTYSHHPVTCAAGLAALRLLKKNRLVERAAEMEGPLFAALDRLRDDPRVGDVRGRGLLAAVELVADRASKEPFARKEKVAERLTAAAFAHGLVVWPNVGHLPDGRGDLVVLAPPFTITGAEIDEAVGLLRAALEDIP